MNYTEPKVGKLKVNLKKKNIKKCKIKYDAGNFFKNNSKPICLNNVKC